MIILFSEKRLLPAVAPPGTLVRFARHYQLCDSCHG